MTVRHRDGTMRRDILSAYLASGARVMSWVIVSALFYRRSTDAFALLALVRGTLGILNYLSLGILPAMIRALATAPSIGSTAVGGAPQIEGDAPPLLGYVTPETTRGDICRRRRADADPITQELYSTGLTIAIVSAMV